MIRPRTIVISLAIILPVLFLLICRISSLESQLDKARADLRAEQDHSAALAMGIKQQSVQIASLQFSGQGCEDARAEDAAAATTRRNIVEQSKAAQQQKVGLLDPGAAKPPQPQTLQNQEQARVRMAVADYLNRPL